MLIMFYSQFPQRLQRIFQSFHCRFHVFLLVCEDVLLLPSLIRHFVELCSLEISVISRIKNLHDGKFSVFRLMFFPSNLFNSSEWHNSCLTLRVIEFQKIERRLEMHLCKSRTFLQTWKLSKSSLHAFSSFDFFLLFDLEKL